MNTKFTGAILDPRPALAKAQDWQHEEVATAVPVVNWRVKTPGERKRYPRKYQKTSLSCMAQSGTKALGVENVVEEGVYVDLSARPVYRKRANFPDEGMWQQDCLSLLSAPNACLETQLKSQNMTEAEMNAPFDFTNEMRAKAEVYRAGGYFTLPIDIEKVAEILEKGKAVQIMLYFLSKEYWRETPTIEEPDLINNPNDPRIQRHGVAAVDYFLLNNKKTLLIEDSSGPNSTIKNENGEPTGQRFITEDFFKKRCFGAGYLVFRGNAPEGIQKPSWRFTKPLSFGLMGNKDVEALQKILQYEGFLSLTIDNLPLPYGNMLQMTCSALKKWQVKHGILDFANEPDVRKVRFGPKSMSLANSIYGV